MTSQRNDATREGCAVCGRRSNLIVVGRGKGMPICWNPDRCYPSTVKKATNQGATDGK